MDKVNILVCDDDKEIVDAIEIYLQQEGYHVIKAYDGEQAIEQLEKNDVQLLIMDVRMPRLDGIRATLKIRENSSIPIIILSAKTEDADKILGLNIGADDYISKPFNPLELVARVKSQLRRYMHLGNVADENMSVYRVGGLEINDDLKMCIRDRLGRVPSAVGYQPTLQTEMGALQERITSTKNGSITSVQAVYVPADDLTDPAPATTFAHLDATTVLDLSLIHIAYPEVIESPEYADAAAICNEVLASYQRGEIGEIYLA